MDAFSQDLMNDLALARAKEAEALRRALNLRAHSAAYADIKDAMLQVDLCHSTVARLQLQLKTCKTK